MKALVQARLLPDGFIVIVNSKNYFVHYPKHIWEAFPDVWRLPFAEFCTFMATIHLTFSEKLDITYSFPPPLAAPFFNYGLILSLPENLLDFDGLKTSDYVKRVMNSFYRTSFVGNPRPLPTIDFKPHPKTAFLPFTFGKDSLLTYAVCRELGIKPIPLFFLEPSNVYENEIKQKLIKEFAKEFDEEVLTFATPLAGFKQTRGLWWGWDIFLTQYTLYLIPFLYYFKPAYFFWSNEFNCNEIVSNDEGFLVNGLFEQSAQWMHILNIGLRLFGITTELGSILEPLTELSILWILHSRYSHLARYQTSCLNDDPLSKTKRWCGRCYECARVYISLLGLGVDPKNISLETDMLSKRKRKLFYVFEENKNDLHSRFKFTKNEKLFAFYLAYQKGVRGGLMSEFISKYLIKTENEKGTSFKEYLSPHPSRTIPEDYKQVVYALYKKQLRLFPKSYIKGSSS